MPVKLLTSGGGGVNLVPSSSIASDQTIYLPTSGTSGGTVLCTDSTGGTANGVLYLNSSKQVTSGSGLVFDSSGNLGIGVTPSAWTRKAIQYASSGSAYIINGTGTMSLGSNFYYDDVANRYISSGKATQYAAGSDGAHYWFTAPSGTAGNAITFTQAMTLDSSGNLGIGVSPVSMYSGHKSAMIGADFVIGGNTANSSTGQAYLTHNLYFDASGNFKVLNTSSANEGAIFQMSDGAFVWQSSAATTGTPTVTEKMRLDTSGNLLVGTTSATSPNPGFGFAVGSNAQLTIGHDTGSAGGQYYIPFKYNGSLIGGITQTGTTAVSYNITSDHRLKTNVRDADARSFNKIKFHDFEWIDGRHDCGVIAHELQEVYPDLVLGKKDAVEVCEVEITPAIKDDDGNVITEAIVEQKEMPVYQQVNYIGLICRMGTVIQQQSQTIESLTQRVEALEYTKQGE